MNILFILLFQCARQPRIVSTHDIVLDPTAHDNREVSTDKSVVDATKEASLEDIK